MHLILGSSDYICCPRSTLVVIVPVCNDWIHVHELSGKRGA